MLDFGFIFIMPKIARRYVSTYWYMVLYVHMLMHCRQYINVFLPLEYFYR